MTASPDTMPPPPGRLAPKTRALLLAIIGAAFAIRLLHFLAISHSPLIKFPLVSDQSDMYAFWQWAHAILEGDWLGRDTYHPYPEWRKQVAPMETWFRWWGGKTLSHQAPLYPYFLAGLLTLKDSVDWVIGVQLLLGALHPLVMFGLARHLFDDHVALLAAALTALYGPFIFYEGVLLRDWVSPVPPCSHNCSKPLVTSVGVKRSECWAWSFLLSVTQLFWAPFRDPVDTVAAIEHISAAQVYLAERRFDEALEEIARFRQTGGTAKTAMFPEITNKATVVEGDAHIQWAFELLRHTQVEEARTHIQLAEQAYATVPMVSEASFNLGLGYLKLRDRDRARSYLEQFLELEPVGGRTRHVEQLLGILNAGAAA